MSVIVYGLGRHKSPDDRDKAFLMSSVLPPAEEVKPRKYRYWNESKTRINQGSIPACVGAAWTHYILNGPVTAPKEFKPDFLGIYKRAQELDEWPGTNYAGTSVRAGAKAVQEQGFISGYVWAWDLETVIQAILNVGPVVAGTNWYRGMSFPDAEGIVKPTGRIDGGHAYLLNGANVERGLVRFEQSWHHTWGDSGNGWISFEDLERLINEAGEMCMATEIKKVV